MAQITTTKSDPNGNNDSGYVPSNIEDILVVSSSPTGSSHDATIFVNRNAEYKSKNGTPLSTKASPKKEPFRFDMNILCLLFLSL